MKHIRMKTNAAGPKWQCHAGQTIHLEDEVADALIAGGHAEPVAPVKPAAPAPVETAEDTQEEVETATEAQPAKKKLIDRVRKPKPKPPEPKQE